MKSIKLLFLFAIVIATIIGGCKKDDNPAGPGGGGPTYYGTFANPAESGSMTLAFASTPKLGVGVPQDVATIINITGTIKIQGGSTITVTGTFNTETDSLVFTGGGYSFAGTLSDGQITGNYTGPNGSGSFSASVGGEGEVKVYCGTYQQTVPDNSESGRFNLVLKGTVITGITDDGLELEGTVEGTTVSIHFKELASLEIAQGTIHEDGSISGQYSVPSETGTRSGTWEAHNCQ